MVESSRPAASEKRQGGSVHQHVSVGDSSRILNKKNPLSVFDITFGSFFVFF